MYRLKVTSTESYTLSGNGFICVQAYVVCVRRGTV